MERLKLTLLTGALLILVGISCIFFYKIIFAKPVSETQNTLNPNVFIENLHSLSFNKDGDVEMNLTTPTMQYNSYSKNAVLENPHITIYQKNTTPWIITADNGNVLQNSSLFKLIGNVQLLQGPTAKTLSTVITTSELTIHPQTHIAETDQIITFTQLNKDHSQIKVNAKGAFVNQNTGEVKLFANTKGVYNAK